MKQSNIALENCPLCGSESFQEAYQIKDHSTSGEKFSVAQCSRCEFLFTNPRPSNQDIGKYYESEKYISHTNQSTGLFGAVYQRVRNRAISKKHKWVLKSATKGAILDYGSGTGEFLNYCKAHGWNTQGIEIAESPRTFAKSTYGLDVLPPEEFKNIPESSKDVVTMWHVLEHLDDLRGSFKKLVSKVKKGGVLVLALPNPESWDAKKYGEYWAAWDVPIHFYHFKKKDVLLLAKEFGLELIETHKMPFDAFYVSLLSEEYMNGKKNWIRATVNGIKSNYFGRRANTSSLTYVLRKV